MIASRATSLALKMAVLISDGDLSLRYIYHKQSCKSPLSPSSPLSKGGFLLLMTE